MKFTLDTTLAELYLADRGGSPTEFRSNLEVGQRLGQAFFNALSGTDQERLRGSLSDPFHLDGYLAQMKIHRAIEWMLDNE